MFTNRGPREMSAEQHDRFVNPTRTDGIMGRLASGVARSGSAMVSRSSSAIDAKATRLQTIDAGQS
jgi:hypothetical protein